MKKWIFLFAILLYSALNAFPQADLKWIGGTVIIKPSTISSGDTVSFSAAFKSIGDLSKNVEVVGGIDGAQTFQTLFPQVASGAQKIVTFTWTATAGNHTVYFEVDPDKTTGDTFYANNVIQTSFNVAGGSAPPPPPRSEGKPNLKVKAMRWKPKQPLVGDTLSVSYSIINDGDAVSPVTYAFLEIDGTTVKSDYIPPLNPGKWTNISGQGKVMACPCKVVITADANNDADEKDEGDNTWTEQIMCGVVIIPPGSITGGDIDPNTFKQPNTPGSKKNQGFTVVGYPNLVMEVNWNPKKFQENQEVVFNYRYKNIGSFPSSPTPGMIFQADGGPTKARAPGAPGTSLAPGGTSSLMKYNWKAKCNGQASAIVDPNNAITETNENDNKWQHVFGPGECTPEPKKPNLRVNGVALRNIKSSSNTGTIYSFNCGDRDVDLGVTIINDGDVPAQTSRVIITVDGCTIESDVLYLGPHKQYEYRMFGTLNCGKKVKVVLDADNQIDESNEKDNIYYFDTWKCNTVYGKVG